MNHRVYIRNGDGMLIGIGVATTSSAASSHGLPVILVRPGDPYTGDSKPLSQRGSLLGAGVYGPADLPGGAVIHDADSGGGNPQWTFGEDVRSGLIASGYATA